jgi:hypothetical protein
VRYINYQGPRCHVGQQDSRALDWLTVRDQVRFFRLVHVFKISKGMSPDYLSGGFTFVKNVHGYSSRGSTSDYCIPDTGLTALQSRSFGFIGRKGWSALPGNLKQEVGLNCFKRKLKAFILQHYQ